MQNKYKALSKNVVLFTISNFGSKLISFLLIPLYTLYLTTSDYGTADLVTTTVSLLIPVLTVNVQDAVLRFSLDKRYTPKQSLRVGIKINAIANFVFVIALLTIRGTGVVKLAPLYCIFAYASFSGGAINNTLQMYLKAVDKVFILTISSILQTLIVCVGNVIALVCLQSGINGYLVVSIIGFVVPAIIMVLAGHIFPLGDAKEDRQIEREMLAYSIPLVLNSVSWWINNASDRYILTFFCGVAVNGIYSVAYKIPTILSTIQSIFYNAWSISAITEFDRNDEDGFFGKTYSVYSFMCMSACAGIIAFNEFLATFLYSGEFFAAWKYVPILLVATLFNGLALFQGCVFTAIKKTKIISSSTLLGAGVNTVFNFILIYYWGGIGAAIATFLGYLTTWIVRTVWLKKYIHMKVNWVRQILSYIVLCTEAICATYYPSIGLSFAFIGILLLLNADFVREIVKVIGKNIRRNKKSAS